MKQYHITIPGKPFPLQRPRFSNGHTFDPQANRDAKQVIAQLGRLEIPEPLQGPVVMELTFYKQRPKAHRKRTGELTKNAPVHWAGKKRDDIDNLIKTVLDGLNGVAFEDDGQVMQLTAEKRYATGEGYTSVAFREVAGDE